MKYPDYMYFPVPATAAHERVEHWTTLAAFADGPVADAAEPLAAEAGRPISEPDRDDTDAMGH